MDKKETVLKNLRSKTRHFGTSNYQGKTILDSRWCHLFLWGEPFQVRPSTDGLESAAEIFWLASSTFACC